MELVVTLIAGAAGHSLLPRLAGAVAGALAAAEPSWLAPGEACDLMLDAPDPDAVEAAARAAIGAAPVDVVVQPVADRRKLLLVADLEATIIENEMLDELGRLHGVGPQIAAITRRAMDGEIDFVEALEARIGLLGGMSARLVDEAARRIRLTPGAREAVATMRRAGAVTALVSGGFTIFAEQVAAELAFDRVVANRIDLVDGRLSGTVRRPIVTGAAKRAVLQGLAAEFDIAEAQTLAVGDGANDLEMLNAAGLGLAFRARPAVAALARRRLDHADLTGLLYAQGYRKDELVA
jgi:phosphoserine phosphatase